MNRPQPQLSKSELLWLLDILDDARIEFPDKGDDKMARKIYKRITNFIKKEER